jgi:hypothetical protein
MTASHAEQQKQRLDNRLLQQKLRYDSRMQTTEAEVFQQIVIAAVEAPTLDHEILNVNQNCLSD